MTVAHRITRITRRTLDALLILLILLVLAVVLLARGIPALTGGATFVVGGGSMEPAIPVGAVVIAIPAAADELAVGDIVSLQVGEQRAVFTHRITRLADRDDGRWLETKGDANEAADPSIVPATAVIGEVAATLPYAGYVMRLLGSAHGVLLVLALAILVMVGAWLLESLEVDHAIARDRAARSIRSLSPDGRAGEGAVG